MKPRLRPISNLYHRWGHLVGLDADQCFEALQAAGLVESAGYTETDKLRNLPEYLFDETVLNVLKRYKEEMRK